MGLTPLPADEWDDDTRRAFAGMLPRERQNPEGAGTALSTLVRHPDLTKAFLGFSVHLLYRSTLPERLREVTILRVAHRHECDYESHHHTDIAREAGFTDAEIEAARLGKSDDRSEQLVLSAVDELFDTSRLSDRTWNVLGEFLDDKQRIDLVFTVGGYSSMAMAFNTFGIEP
ncbi:carboxymuconolactone decarboxylase family protein [Rhodococcus triatomae]|nr:carboxymuconolactone decarboxylase [Rhodococcus triatomae BKS 15-14]